MRDFAMKPQALCRSLWQHRSLAMLLIKREIASRYQGSMVGMLWLFINPLLMLSIYTFVFSVVFKARWGSDIDSRAEFALILFIGLLLFNLFADCIQRAPTLILHNMNYVKKLIFPLEILPWVTFCSALFHFMVGMIVWLLFFTLLHGLPSWRVVFLPVILVPLVGWTLGSIYLLAAVGVALRDMTQIVGIMTSLLLFLSPVFYPVSQLSSHYQKIIYLNPLTWIVENARALLLFSELPMITALLIASMASMLWLWICFCSFQHLRRLFADIC